MKTTTPKCPACGAASRDWSLCKVCTETLLTDLRELPDVMRDLQDKRIGRTVMPAPANLVGNPEESPVPFSDHARRVHDVVASTVGTWIRALDQDDLIEPYGRWRQVDDRPPIWSPLPIPCTCISPWRPRRYCRRTMDLRPAMASWCAWLIERIDRIRFHEAADQIAEEIGGCLVRARKAVDLPPELRLVQKCETCGHGIFAGREDKTVVCTHCKRAGVDPLPQIDVEKARDKLGDMVEHQWATAAKCALVLAAYGLPVKADTVQNWARPERGGRLKAQGVDHAGRRLYRVGDVADLVRAATRRATSNDGDRLDNVTQCNA